jgi:hypothetical protein
MTVPTVKAASGLINIVALGWALSAALVVLYVICALAGMIFPEALLTHGWLSLFSTAPLGTLKSFVDGIVGSIGFAWVTAFVLGLVYNRLASRG